MNYGFIKLFRLQKRNPYKYLDSSYPGSYLNTCTPPFPNLLHMNFLVSNKDLWPQAA